MDEVCVWCGEDVGHEPDCPKIVMDSMQSHIKDLESKLDEYEHRAKLHMDRCQHDMERIVALEQQNEALASRLGAAENAMREVVSHLQRSQRGSTHWAGCTDVHPVCQAIAMLVDALPLRDSPAGPVS